MPQLKTKPAQWESLKKSLRNGATITKACKAAKISRDTWWRHNTGDSEESRKFQAEVKKIMRVRSEVVEDALYKNAIEGNFQAQKYWLNNRKSNKWADKTNTIIEATVDINITDEQRRSELSASIRRRLAISQLAEREN